MADNKENVTLTEMQQKEVSQEKISDIDKMALEVAKVNKKLALANAEKALAQNETAELAFKYVVLQVYMKYGLTDKDALDEAGNIIRNNKK